MLSIVEKLRHRGFDKSYAVPFRREWKVLCSQCEAAVINSIPCHEFGCPNKYLDTTHKKLSEEEE